MNSLTKYYFVPRADTFRVTCLSNPVRMYLSLIDFTLLIAHYLKEFYISVLFRIHMFLFLPSDTLLAASVVLIVFIFLYQFIFDNMYIFLHNCRQFTVLLFYVLKTYYYYYYYHHRHHQHHYSYQSLLWILCGSV
jgi:hypothetical protein